MCSGDNSLGVQRRRAANSRRPFEWLRGYEVNQVANRAQSAIERILRPTPGYTLALLDKLRYQELDIFGIDPKLLVETICRTERNALRFRFGHRYDRVPNRADGPWVQRLAAMAIESACERSNIVVRSLAKHRRNVL